MREFVAVRLLALATVTSNSVDKMDDWSLDVVLFGSCDQTYSVETRLSFPSSSNGGLQTVILLRS